MRQNQVKTRDNKCTRCSPPGDQLIYIPLIDLPEAGGGEIVFNSRSPEAMDVTPVFYKRNGETVIGDAVKIQSAEIRYVNIEDLLPARYRHERDWGGFALSYYGANRQMWSQFRFLGVNGGANVDEFFTVKDESRSAVYEAAWWMPEKSEAIVALGNISDAATSATLSFGNGHSRTVQLQPHATELVREEHRNEGTESVKIDVTGAAGSIVPTGIITTKDGSFNSVIRFYDPTKAKQPNLYANGFRVAGITPHMVLKNTTQSSIAVLPKIIPMSGSAGIVTLSQVSLDPNETKEVDLSDLLRAAKTRRDLDVVSVEVSNWAAPGSVIGSLYSTDNRTGSDYDVPLRDSGPIRSMTGAYPWKIDGDYKSIAYVTNITDEPVEFVAELAYDGGKFTLGPRKLQARETANFDLEKIRDEQMKDVASHALPANVTHGQFKWAIRGASNGKIVLIGRTEMISRAQNVSSSYSCPMDCGPTYECDVQYPGLIGFLQSETGSVTETASWNYGYTMGPYPTDASWSVDEPIASFDPSSASETSITAVDEGQANLSAFVGYFDRYDWDGLECVWLGTVLLQGGGQMQVVRVRWQTAHSINGMDAAVPIASGTPPQGSPSFVNTTTITGIGIPSGGTYSWSTSSNKVTLSNSNSATVTVTGVTESQSTRDVTINLTYTYQGRQASEQVPLTVQKPTFMDFVSIDGSGAANDCASGRSGPFKDITWQLADKNHNRIPFAIPTYDTLTNVTPNSCFVPEAGEGTAPGFSTDGTGKWPHHYNNCSTACNNGGSCSLSGTQKYFANGFQIDLAYSMSCATITVAGH
ncbi:MAG: hypothetical protein DMF72_05905 [Acidobacteria bacterium]|nr:MAG: hypothetical protein DMF72_05905 [Acidobacteriota bacterium]